VLVDADACPVKDEVYKVALRYEVPVTVVSNAFLRLPDHPLIDRIIVEAEPDAADDAIAERADAQTIVITADILLAERCVKAGASVLAPNGKPFTADSIGSAVATRALMQDLRSSGENIGGPSAFTKKDRSRFLSALDTMIVKLRRA
jgi:hypothetical protein